MSMSSARFDRFVLFTLIAFTLFIVGMVAARQFRQPGGARVSSSQLPVMAQLPDFVLTNQTGAQVMLSQLGGKVWVADIIFTRCAGPCPKMTQRMSELQTALAKESGVQLVTLTTDPEFDTPAVLTAYGAKYGADAARWQFLTGTKGQVARLAIDGLKLTTLEKAPGERADPADLFIHSTMFVLVDKSGRLRGVYETTGEDINWTNVKERIIADTRRLLREPRA
jgi:protein SCO1/2